MEFRTGKGERLEHVLDGDVVRLEESRSYQLAVQLGESARAGWRCWFGEVELPWHAGIPGFELQIPFWAGNGQLRLQTPEGERCFQVEVQPREEKLSSEAWATLLQELDAWLPGSTVGQEGGVHGEVGLEGSEAPAAAAVLGQLVPAFIAALKDVLVAPRERSVEQWTEAPAHTVRQADPRTLRWLVRHPDVYQYVRGETEERRDGRALLVPRRTRRGHLDHEANRYVAYLVWKVEEKLRELARQVRAGVKKVKSLNPDLQRWCEGRALRLEEGADELQALRRTSPLQGLSPAPISESALLTLMDDPLYARVHRRGQLFLSWRFRLRDERAQVQAPVRPSYELYELWTFLAMRRLLAEALPGGEWMESGLGRLRLFGQVPEKDTGFTADYPGRGLLELLFNPSFPGLLSRGASPRWSISKSRLPDIVVSWQPRRGPARWLCLDAKYRTRAHLVADAFESVHIYRDSLRWQGFADGGRCAGAVLLVPATDPKAQPWFEKPFRDEHGAGVFQLTPNQPPPAGLLEWVRTQLGCAGLS